MGLSFEKPKREYRYSQFYVKAKPGIRIRDRRVTILAHRVRTGLPWLEPSDWPIVRSWCEIEVLCEQAYAILRTAGIVNKDGEPRRLLEDFRKLRTAQIAIARELGMTPASRMAIKGNAANAALDLVAAFAQPQPSVGEAVVDEDQPAARVLPKD